MNRVVLFALAACAAAPRPRPVPPVVRLEMDAVRIEVDRGSGAMTVTDPAVLFEEAGQRLDARDDDGALARYDRLVAEFPDSRHVPAALYNAGLACEGRGDFPAAAARYETLAARFPDTRDGLDGLFRLGAARAELSQWSASAVLFERALVRTDLTLSDRVEAFARLGLARFEQGDRDGAERTLREGIAHYRQNELLERLDTRFFIGLAHHYVGAIAHARFRDVPVRLPEAQMEQDLEEKSRLLLAAQEAYIAAIRERDPYWASASGYRIGVLYRELHDALLAAPIPPELNAEAQQIYREELRKAVRPLLEKAIKVYDKTLEMAERVGVRNGWVEQSLEQLETMRALLRAADAAAAPAAPPDG
jgi:tetratricopeptide (TPR) repeat protein